MIERTAKIQRALSYSGAVNVSRSRESFLRFHTCPDENDIAAASARRGRWGAFMIITLRLRKSATFPTDFSSME